MPLVIQLFFQRAGGGVMVIFGFSLPFCPTRVPADHGAMSYIHTAAVPQFPLSEPEMGLLSVPLFAHPMSIWRGENCYFVVLGAQVS